MITPMEQQEANQHWPAGNRDDGEAVGEDNAQTLQEEDGLKIGSRATTSALAACMRASGKHRRIIEKQSVKLAQHAVNLVALYNAVLDLGGYHKVQELFIVLPTLQA